MLQRSTCVHSGAAECQLRSEDILFQAGIFPVAVNLRPALDRAAPLFGDIRHATDVSDSLLGVPTTIPPIAFGIILTLTPW